MKIVIPGGSGQVGTIFARAFQGDGHEVVVLSRRPAVRPWRVVAWDGFNLGDWQSEIDGCDVVINLTGRSVNCRYTAANRQEILQSRVFSTRVVGVGDRTSVSPATAVAASEHRHDLRAPVRRPERRALGHSRRQRTDCTERLAIQHRGRARMGAGFRGGRHGWDSEDRASFSDDVESRRWRHLRRTPRARTPRPRRQRR